jgi:hypothetical protein
MDSRTTTQHPGSSPANGSSTNPDWSTLLSRMFDDLSRVIHLELELIEARIVPSLTGIADRAIGALVLLSGVVIGGSCLLAAFILWLHQWMPWWQCFGAGGIVAIVCGVVGYTIASGLAARNRTEKPASTLPIPESTISHYEK